MRNKNKPYKFREFFDSFNLKRKQETKEKYIDDANILICGKNKKDLLNEIYKILYETMLYFTPNELNFVIIDKTSELNFLQGIGHIYKNTIYKDIKSIKCVISNIIKESTIRKEILESKNCKNFDEYMKLDDRELKRYYVVIKDFDFITRVDKEMEELITTLLGLKNLGISVAMTTSKVNSKAILNTYRLLINKIICYQLNTKEESIFLLGQSGAEKLETETIKSNTKKFVIGKELMIMRNNKEIIKDKNENFLNKHSFIYLKNLIMVNYDLKSKSIRDIIGLGVKNYSFFNFILDVLLNRKDFVKPLKDVFDCDFLGKTEKEQYQLLKEIFEDKFKNHLMYIYVFKYLLKEFRDYMHTNNNIKGFYYRSKYNNIKKLTI